MPLIIDGGRIPPRWAEKRNSLSAGLGGYNGLPECVRIAFVNNMPDAALEDTEMQFFELLDEASGDLPVLLKLHSLAGVPRGERGHHHVNAFYSSANDVLNNPFDALIMTGTEPQQPSLRNEPYWSALADVLDWAETNTASTILSCLAAHAGVLHSDGIERHPLTDKQFGVFDFASVRRHELNDGTVERVCFPHSRWNEVRADALTANGYLVLTQSAEGGVDSFVKRKKRSLFVHFQGHPEYGAQTLLREYRRDVKRFLRRERETYPSMPKGYFQPADARLVTDFRDAALSDRQEDLIESFPEATLARTLQKTWHAPATAIYRNWLRYVLLNKAETPGFMAVASVRDNVQRKRSAVR
jgi:homoserine O-succinyltransferase